MTPEVELNTFHLTDCHVVFNWQVTSGKVYRAQFGYRMNLEDVSDNSYDRFVDISDVPGDYIILHDDISMEDENITIWGEFNTSLAYHFMIYAFEGSLTSPTAASHDSEGIWTPNVSAIPNHTGELS